MDPLRHRSLQLFLPRSPESEAREESATLSLPFLRFAQANFRRSRKSSLGAGRLLKIIAIGGAIALAGCSDATAPSESTPPAESLATTAVSALVALAAELHDATDIFVPGVQGEALRGNVQLAITALADQLLAGNVDGSRAALAQARTLLVNLDDISAIQLAPVGLAFDYIESKINEAAGS